MTSKCSSSSIKDGEPFQHKIQLYLADAYGIRVPKTEFWITLTIVKDGFKVTIQVPAINFETGPFANNIYETANPVTGGNYLPPPQNGGYLYTLSGFLPKELRPNELINLTYFAGSNNGNNTAFSYGPPLSFPSPIAGYLLQLTNAGALVIQGIGTPANLIPPGQQNLMPTSFTYIAKPKIKLCNNTQISLGAINTEVFPFGSFGSNDGVRDTQINDAFDGVMACVWADNSSRPYNQNTMGIAVSVGKVKDGKLKMRAPIFLSTPYQFYVSDTAIAINRTDKKNIVVSYGLLNFNATPGEPESQCFRAVSFDGGKTWPLNGLTQHQPTGSPSDWGDLPGVKCDKFGTFWYMTTNLFDENCSINQPFFMISTDQGQTFQQVAYAFPSVFPSFYDSPEFCFGDGQGNYGIHFTVDFFPDFFLGQLDGFPFTGFIPITGLGQFGSVQTAFLPQFTNTIFIASITASEDGKVWLYGSPPGLGPAAAPYPGSGINNNRLVFKSPGPVDQNYVGPWEVAIFNQLNLSLYFPVYEAQPVVGFFVSVQTNIYDDKRQALYVVLSAVFPDNSQNTRLYFMISRNNGQSWSNPIDISNSDVNNRGFASMALDSITGNLLISWYDGRNYTDNSFNYFGTVINSKTLDMLVEQIPLSDPTYSISAIVVEKNTKSKISEGHICSRLTYKAKMIKEDIQSK